MNYVKEYYEAIEAGQEVVPQKIKALYQREVQWMNNPPDDFPFYFDEDQGERPIYFIETFCRHSKGKQARQTIRLELFQKAKLQLAFGWLEKETNKRRFHEVVDLRARKCGKSTETAGVGWYCLVGDGESGAEIYCAANKLDQAKVIFDEAVNMRTQSKALRSVTKKRQSDIYFPTTFSVMKPLAADSKTMDGLNAHFFALDEFHEARNRKVYDVLKQSQSAREQPLAWLISTNGFVRELFFDNIYDYASSVALWDDGYHDYRLLPLIYELDKREEWTNPKCWAKANPGLGVIKSIKTLAENVERAKRDPEFLATVLTKDFNIPENTADTWLSFAEAVNEESIDMEYLRNSYAIGGCDLSATTDLTCATLLIRKPNDKNFYVLQKYFLPQMRVDEVEMKKEKEAPYKTWYEKGWLEICEGATVDYKKVTEWFVSMVKEYNIRPLWIGYDAALSGYWREEMEESGFDMEKIRQGAFTWTYPMKQLKGLFEEHKIIYDNNPMLRWCLLNTGKKTLNKDGIESIQPVKCSQSKRIDGMVSLLNAVVSYYNHEDDYLRYVK
ncbi:MAG: terminase large subunit [Peptococcaceae bacterium]|nr:terminase large subunit [Peptococcaceae bacterium]